MVVRHPARLGNESKRWIPRHSAQAFHQLSLLLATLIATGMTAIFFALRTEQVQEEISLYRNGQNLSVAPLYVLTDSWWVLLPMAAWFYATFVFSMSLYRLFLRLGSGNRRHRIRVGRIGYFASAHLVPLTLLAGPFALLEMLLYRDPALVTGVQYELLYWGGVAIYGSGLFGFLLPTLILVFKTGKLRVVRAILMFPIYLYLVIAGGFALLVAIFWALGYAILVIKSVSL